MNSTLSYVWNEIFVQTQCAVGQRILLIAEKSITIRSGGRAAATEMLTRTTVGHRRSRSVVDVQRNGKCQWMDETRVLRVASPAECWCACPVCAPCGRQAERSRQWLNPYPRLSQWKRVIQWKILNYSAALENKYLHDFICQICDLFLLLKFLNNW